MSLRRSTPWIAGLALLAGCAAEEPAGFPLLEGPLLGQTPPGTVPELFAPGIVSTGLQDRDVAIHPDGSEIYFGQATGSWSVAAIMVTRLEGGRWTEPVVAPFCEAGRIELEPHFSPDGRRLYFLSDRPDRAAGEEEGGDQDIWFVEREGDGWGEARNLGAPINTDEPEFYPSLTRDGTLYFTRGGRESFIYRSRLVDGVYEEPVRLPEQVNAGATQFNAFVDPDEKWILVPIAGMEESLGGIDYFVSFRSDDDTWTGPIHLEHGINSEATREWSASLTPDGRYLFFMSARTIDLEEPPRTQREMIELTARPGNGASDIYWIDASVIESYRPR